MLNQLDILIGFVVVMSIVSLMVMVAAQTCSSFFGLRGKNLRDAVETLFYHIAPQLDPTSRSQLIESALTSPIASDTTFSTRTKEGFLRRWIPGLRWLRSLWMRATAIRADELLELLQRKATGPAANMLQLLEAIRTTLNRSELQSVRDAFTPALDALDRILEPQATTTAGENTVGAALVALTPAAKTTPPSPSAGTAPAKPAKAKESQPDAAADVAAAVLGFRAALARPEVRALPPTVVADLQKLDAQIEKTVAEFDVLLARLKSGAQRQALLTVTRAAREVVNAVQTGQAITADETARFEKWFNSAQDRAQQWFTMHIRIVTVIASIIAAFALQLDTFRVFHVLATNPDIRAKLVARAESLQLEEQAAVRKSFTPQMHADAIAMMKKSHPQWALPSAALPVGYDVAAAEKWFAQQLQQKPSPDNDDIYLAYQQAVLRQQIESNVASLQALARETSQSTLQLMPSPYPISISGKSPDPRTPEPPWYRRFMFSVDTGNGTRTYWSWPLSHLAGICVSAALLGLGAPFWFSLLNGLTSLRPALAEAIDKNPTSEAARKPATK